jgi:hypothetical protein
MGGSQSMCDYRCIPRAGGPDGSAAINRKKYNFDRPTKID